MFAAIPAIWPGSPQSQLFRFVTTTNKLYSIFSEKSANINALSYCVLFDLSRAVINAVGAIWFYSFPSAAADFFFFLFNPIAWTMGCAGFPDQNRAGDDDDDDSKEWNERTRCNRPANHWHVCILRMPHVLVRHRRRRNNRSMARATRQQSSSSRCPVRLSSLNLNQKFYYASMQTVSFGLCTIFVSNQIIWEYFTIISEYSCVVGDLLESVGRSHCDGGKLL